MDLLENYLGLGFQHKWQKDSCPQANVKYFIWNLRKVNIHKIYSIRVIKMPQKLKFETLTRRGYTFWDPLASFSVWTTKVLMEPSFVLSKPTVFIRFFREQKRQKWFRKRPNQLIPKQTNDQCQREAKDRRVKDELKARTATTSQDGKHRHKLNRQPRKDAS